MTNNHFNGVVGPKEVKFFDLGITSAWAVISGVVGSVVLLFVVILSWGLLDVASNFKQATNGLWENSSMFPLLLSFITFIVTLIVSGITYFFLTLTDPMRYKSTLIHYAQIAFFTLVIYIFLAPVYIYSGIQDYKNIMYVFLLHNLLLSFGIVILLELMNNYRYILLWFYGSFVWLLMTWLLTFLMFSYFWDGYAKLIALLIIMPLINGCVIFFKGVFEMLYFQYYMYFGMDQLGDIFRQIELEEAEIERKSVQQNYY